MQKQKRNIAQKAKIQLVITRHGQTQQNKNKIICGQNPGKLTEQGKLQAQMIGQYLASKQQNHQFNKIYVSDLGRTVQTFENIKLKAPYLQKIQTKLTLILRQKHGGILTGQPLTAWDKQAKKENKSIREYKCKDGESWVDVNKRVHRFLQMCVKQNILEKKEKPQLEQKILVICHGGYIMQFHNVCKQIASKGKQKAVFSNSAKNCSIHIFEIQYPISSEQNKLKQQYIQNRLSIKCKVDNFTAHLNVKNKQK